MRVQTYSVHTESSLSAVTQCIFQQSHKRMSAWLVKHGLAYCSPGGESNQVTSLSLWPPRSRSLTFNLRSHKRSLSFNINLKNAHWSSDTLDRTNRFTGRQRTRWTKRSEALADRMEGADITSDRSAVRAQVQSTAMIIAT